MPRENPQKRHRRLRLQAEVRKRAAADARARAQSETELRETRVQVALRDGLECATEASAPDTLPDTVRFLLERAGLAGAVPKRVQALFARIRKEIPTLYEVGSLPLLVLLAREPWVRPLDAWVAPWGSQRHRRDALVDHLLVRFPVPRVLYATLNLPRVYVARVPEEDAWGVRFLAALGRGESAIDAVRSGAFPVPLTRAMLAQFFRTRPGVPVVLAIRRAQVAGYGGPAPLADALVKGRLGGLRGLDPDVGEPFWAGVIAWLSRRSDLKLALVPAMLEYIEARQRAAIAEGARFSLAGRTGASLGRLVAAWIAEQAVRGPRFPASGYLPLNDGEWSVREVETWQALRALGEVMKHCVAAYAGLIRARKVAIFVVNRGDAPSTTVEVAMAVNRVVQAKAANNAPCPEEDRRVLTAWAGMNRLEVAVRL